MKIRFITFLVIGVLLISVSACDKSMVYDEFRHISDNSWEWNEKPEFIFDAPDTTSLYDLLISVRHTIEYPLSNLYMFVHVTGPGGREMTDTINFRLADKSGEWLGRGLGNIREIGYLYRSGTAFPEKGNYTFVIEQAMRLPEVPVSEVGFRIEKHNP